MGRMPGIYVAVACAVAFALPSGVTAENRIEFGPPGPPHTMAFDDGVVVVSATFRVAHDRHHDGGPAGVSPSISSGSLTVRAFGVSRRYDLSTILPIATNRIVLSERGECGTSTALSHLGSYLAIEAGLAEKGCAPLLAFVDLHTGRVAKEAVFDPAWLHRFDVNAFRASGTDPQARS